MRLWTIQSYEAYEKLINTGILRANKTYICDENFCYAYKWIIEKMKSNSIILPENVEYPIWGWYQMKMMIIISMGKTQRNLYKLLLES